MELTQRFPLSQKSLSLAIDDDDDDGEFHNQYELTILANNRRHVTNFTDNGGERMQLPAPLANLLTSRDSNAARNFNNRTFIVSSLPVTNR